MYQLYKGKEKIENQWMISYGITWEGGQISGIMTDRKRMQEFIDRCNREGVEPEFLREVLDAYLG